MCEGAIQIVSGKAECIMGHIEDAQIRITFEELMVNTLYCTVTHVKHLKAKHTIFQNMRENLKTRLSWDHNTRFSQMCRKYTKRLFFGEQVTVENQFCSPNNTLYKDIRFFEYIKIRLHAYYTRFFAHGSTDELHETFLEHPL